MVCCGNRKKQTREFADLQWHHISLNDFKSSGCGEPFAYGYLWFSLILSVAVYAVDSFTAVQLLAFNRWSSSIDPAISFSVSRWIFAICIILSFINLAYEAVRAIKVMKRNNVAESYMDPLAVCWQSIRVGKGQGWRRFLVFAALTKSKKGAEYIALFTYFGFKSWIRVLVCSAPRQVVNAFTLRSVYVAKLSTDAKSVDGAFLGFFDKVKILAQEDYRQAAILSGMAFTFVIWAFALIFLILSVLFYVLFLFHWIPRADGGLTGYCERKINKALLKIVTTRVNKALAKNQLNRMKAEAKAAKATGEKVPERMATLPNMANFSDDNLPGMPMLSRAGTDQTLPLYTSRPNTPGGGIELNHMNRVGIGRTITNSSNSSLSATVPLVSAAADMGHVPTSPSVYTPPPSTCMSQRSQMSGMLPPPPPPPSHAGAAMQPSGPKQYRPYNPSARSYSPVTQNPYFAEPSPGLQRAPMQVPVRSATAGPMTHGGPSQYPVQRSATGPCLPNRTPTFDTYQQRPGPRPGPRQNMPILPPQGGNTSDEFFNGRWIPPSQRRKPGRYM